MKITMMIMTSMDMVKKVFFLLSFNIRLKVISRINFCLNLDYSEDEDEKKLSRYMKKSLNIGGLFEVFFD